MKIKSLLWSAAALAALSACSSEVDVPMTGSDGDEVVISYSVKVPEQVLSRSFSDGTKAKNLHYAVYEVSSDEELAEEAEAGTLKPTLTDNVTMHDLEADIQLHLLKGKKYQVVFWAQASNAPYTYRDNTQTVSVDYANANSNDDDLDAFYAFEEIDVECAYGRALFLTRAFAQINFGANDVDQAKKLHINVNRSTISTTAYTKLNLRTREVSDPEEVIYKLTDTPIDEAFPVDGVKDYVSMNYILAPDDSEELESVTLYVDDQFQRTFDNIPIQRNHRTNVYGDLFTDKASYKVTIRADYDVAPWDGTSTLAKRPNEDGIIELTSASELARLPEMSNEHGNTYEGDTFVLTQDIDLNCKPWDPICATEYVWGYDWNEDTGSYDTEKEPKFSGTFDGQGHTIYNLHIDLDKLQTTNRYYWDDEEQVKVEYQEAYRFAGLFGQLDGATIKNLTIENVIIHNNSETESEELLYTGILAGVASDSHFENVKIKGIVVVTSDCSKCPAKAGYLGGLVGAADGGCDFKDITIDVQDGSYILGSDCPYVGGLTGRFWEGTCSNVKSNLNVIGSNPLAKRTAVGGLVGLIKQKARVFTDCSCSGNVTLNNYAGTIVDKDGDKVLNALNMGVGGLVGAGYEIVPAAKAVFTRCSFTGDVISNYIGTGGVITDYSDILKTNNPSWRYMGWVDSGMSWKANTDAVSIVNE